MKRRVLKRLRAAFLMGVGIFLALVVFVVFVDPFYHYHAPVLGMKTYLYNAVYQAPGVARNYEYDSAILGTSMTENFHTNWFRDELGLQTVKLSYSGARTSDLDAILEQVFASGNEIKKIYLDLNGYQLEVPSDSAYVERPKYLYDENPFNDVEYVCNIDTLSTCVGSVIATMMGREDNMDSAYTWNDPEAFGKDKVMEVALAAREQAIQATMEEEDARQSLLNCQRNLDNIGKHIVAHPETKFVVMYVPYHVMYWDDANEEMRDLRFEMYEMSLRYFGDMPNVEMYFFLDDYEVITDFSLFRDLGHYPEEVNYRMFQDLSVGNFKVDKEEGIQRLEELKKYVEEYDFDSIWDEYNSYKENL